MKWQRSDTYFALFSLSLGLLTLGSIRELIRFSLDSANVAASQIIVVPFVTAFLIFVRRDTIFASVQYSYRSGLSVIGVGAGLLLLANVVAPQLRTPDGLALMTGAILLTWMGGFILFYGLPSFRSGLFPLLFLVFCIPFPVAVLERTIEFLRWGSAEMAYGMLRVSGTPVFRDGYVMALPGLTIEIAPECSGIRSGIGMLMTSLLAGYLLLESWVRRLVLVVVALPLLLLKNAIRIDTLSLLSVHVDPGIIEGRLHHEGGIVFFAVGLALLYPVLKLLMKSEQRANSLFRTVSGAI